MKKLLSVMIIAVVLFSGCATLEELSTKTKTGAGIGAVAGGILGAVVDSDKPWRGAIIGAAAGAAAGGWIGHTMDKETGEPIVQADADIVAQAAAEAAKQNATIKYSRVTEGGVNEEIIAKPGELSGNLRTVTIQYFRDGKLISTETRQVAV
jgi:phage tail tape-measure protein